jgi:YggT family protein
MASNPPAGDPGYDQEVVARAQRQQIVTPSGEVAGQDVAVTETVDNVEARRSTANWITGLIYFLFGLIEIAIALRILLKLLAADPNAGFSRFIYGVTGPFVAPFAGIIGEPAASNGSVFELSSVLALIIYLLLSWIVAKLVQLLIDRPASGVSASRSVGRNTTL